MMSGWEVDDGEWVESWKYKINFAAMVILLIILRN